MMTLIILIIISASFTTLLAQTPLIIGLNILLIALLIAGSFARIYRSWYAFLIFLIYVGGILVIFAYFVAIVPNQQIRFSINIKIFLSTLFIISLLCIIVKSYIPLNTSNSLQLSTLYTVNNTPILAILVLVLLVTIIIVVKITTRVKGPLRPFFYV